MLPRQDSRRSNNRHLFAAHRHSKGCAQGHFSFTKANIAANQAVHRLSAFKVAHHIVNSGQLVICFGVREARRKFIISALIHRQRLSRSHSAFCGDDDKLSRHFAQLAFGLGFTGLPRRAAQTVQNRAVTTATVT